MAKILDVLLNSKIHPLSLKDTLWRGAAQGPEGRPTVTGRHA